MRSQGQLKQYALLYRSTVYLVTKF